MLFSKKKAALLIRISSLEDKVKQLECKHELIYLTFDTMEVFSCSPHLQFVLRCWKCEKIIEIFPLLPELAKFPCQYANRRDKEDYQKCKKFNIGKNLINTSFVKQ